MRWIAQTWLWGSLFSFLLLFARCLGVARNRNFPAELCEFLLLEINDCLLVFFASGFAAVFAEELVTPASGERAVRDFCFAQNADFLCDWIESSIGIETSVCSTRISFFLRLLPVVGEAHNLRES